MPLVQSRSALGGRERSWVVRRHGYHRRAVHLHFAHPHEAHQRAVARFPVARWPAGHRMARRGVAARRPCCVVDTRADVDVER
jgi:hypothetical protein